MPELPELIKKAKKAAIEENWELVDRKLVPEISKHESSKLVGYVGELIMDRNGNVRDLGATLASLLEKEDMKQISKELKYLTLEDPNVYASFRAFIALKKHGLHKEIEEEAKRILKKVMEMEKEGEVYQLAKKHLEELKTNK